jgi:hypothetical protein
VQDRLDAVMGVGNWMDDYEILSDGSVVCRLRLRIDGEWITKADVGSLSEQPDAGDRLKAAFSDSLKRAAVKYGIGRYLYDLQSGWADYDPQAKRFTAPPQLPAWALPKGHKTQPPQQQQQQQRPPHQQPPVHQQPAPQQSNLPPRPTAAPPQQPQQPAANPAGDEEFYKTTLHAVRDCRSDNELTAVKQLARTKWGTLNSIQKDGLTVAVRAKEDQFKMAEQPAPDDVPY